MNLLPRHLPMLLYLRNCQQFLFWGSKLATKIHSGLNFGMCYRVTNPKWIIFRKWGEGGGEIVFWLAFPEVQKYKIENRSWWFQKNSERLILLGFSEADILFDSLVYTANTCLERLLDNTKIINSICMWYIFH